MVKIKVDPKNTRSLLVEALGVNEQVKEELRQLKKQNDYLESLLGTAEENLLKDR